MMDHVLKFGSNRAKIRNISPKRHIVNVSEQFFFWTCIKLHGQKSLTLVGWRR